MSAEAAALRIEAGAEFCTPRLEQRTRQHFMGPSLWYHCGYRTWLGPGCRNFCFQTSFVKGKKHERRLVPLWMVKVQHMSAETADSAAE